MADPSTIFSSVGIVAWHRSDTFGNSGGLLTSVPDQSGNGRDWTINGAPTYSSTGYSASIPSATFNGTADYLSSTAIGSLMVGGNNNACYAALIFKRDSSIASGECFINLGGNSGSANQFARFVAGTSATQWEVRWRNASSGAGAGGVGGTVDANWHLVEIVRTTTTVDLLIDGVSQIGGPQTVNVDMGTIDRASIAALVRNTVSSYCNMSLAEDVLLDGIPTAAEIASYRRYVSERYGLVPTVAGTLGGLTAAVASDISGSVSGVLPGLVGAVTATQTLPSTIGRPKVTGSACGSSTLNTNGATVGWSDHYRNFLQALNPASDFITHAASGLSSWSHLPTGTTGQPAGAPAVDTARNITACIADNPDFIIVNTNSDWTAGTVGLSIAAADMDNVGGYVDLYLIPNYQTILAEAQAAGIPCYFTTGQPVDTGASAERTAFLLYAKQRMEEVFSGYCINFYDVLVDVDGTLIDAYTDDDTHPNDTATPLLSDVVEALDLELVTAGNLPGLVGAIVSDTEGAIISVIQGQLPGLTGAIASTQTIPSTIAGVLGELTANIRTDPTVAAGGGSMRGRRSRVRRR